MAADQSVFNVLLAVFPRFTFLGALVFFFHEQSDWSYPSKSSVSGKTVCTSYEYWRILCSGSLLVSKTNQVHNKTKIKLISSEDNFPNISLLITEQNTVYYNRDN